MGAVPRAWVVKGERWRTCASVRLSRYPVSHILRGGRGWMHVRRTGLTAHPRFERVPMGRCSCPSRRNGQGLRFNVETAALRYNLPKYMVLLSSPMSSRFGWSITHQRQDCISGKQGRRWRNIQISEAISNSKTREEIRHTNEAEERVKREANVSVNDFEVDVMMRREMR